jgi:pyruvate formate lyase activating enzyme
MEESVREAIAYDRLPGSRVRCRACQWYCHISPGRLGYCRTRQNRDGTLYTLIYGDVSSSGVDPIEKKPLFHFYPGTQAFSLGTWGCNFRCHHCQNWQIAYGEYDGQVGCIRVQGRSQQGHYLSPEQSVEIARQHRCGGISWTYNEPSIWLEYTIDNARLAKRQGLYTAYVTNGFISPEGLDAIGPYLDAYRVDIKGFSDEFYFRLLGLPKTRSWRGILDLALRAKEKWGMHVEAVTNIVPGYNDDDTQLEGIAAWLHDHLGPNTPWHVTRFYPQAELTDVPPTPLTTIERARRIGMEKGLHFVYTGNVPSDDGQNTYCYNCQHLVIERSGYHTRLREVAPGGRCANCGADLNLRGV